MRKLEYTLFQLPHNICSKRKAINHTPSLTVGPPFEIEVVVGLGAGAEGLQQVGVGVGAGEL